MYRIQVLCVMVMSVTQDSFTCENCGRMFTRAWYPSRPRPRACRVRCAALLRPRKPVPTWTGPCEWCGKPFTKTVYPSSPQPRFCTTSCSAKWRMSRPEYVATLHTDRQRAAARQNIIKARQAVSPDYLSSDRNPFFDPAVRQKSRETNAARGWPQLTGGNGTGPTIPQAMLHKALGDGWQLELAIRTGMGKGSGYPGAYKADISNRAQKIVIEVHGKGHSKSGNARDRKKRDLLESLGWTVLWIWNTEILNDLSGTLRRIRVTISPTEF